MENVMWLNYFDQVPKTTTMKHYLLALPLLSLLFTTAGCYKSKVNHPIGNRREMLTGSSWRIGELRDNGNVVSPGCKTDDTWVFSSDGGTGYIDDGMDRCSAEDNTTFNYSVTGDQRFVYILYMSNPTTYGTYHTDSHRLDFEFVYMTENELCVKYYDRGAQTGQEHQYEIRFDRVR
jgi:hypothetical protein